MTEAIPDLDRLSLASVTSSQIDMTNIHLLQPLYAELVSPYPTLLGKAASRKDREEQGLKQSTLVYGEISFESFGIALEKIKNIYGKPNVGTSGPNGVMQRGGIFYDLGSGTGKPVFAAAILHDFHECVGIEILDGLYVISLDMLNTFNSSIKNKLPPRERDSIIHLIQGDFTKMKTKDWRDADVVFANSTCYDDPLMETIGKLAAGLKKGAFVISLTKRVPSPDLTVLEHELHTMSWGEATVYIMQKTTDPHSVDSDDD